MKNILCLFAISIIAFACSDDETPTQELFTEINSAAVAFSYEDGKFGDFFQDPSQALITGYFYFEEDLAEDVIFGLDIEWLEGTDNPIHVSGGDWMALAGFNRSGILWYPVGSPENLDGIPTDTDKWEVRDIGAVLEPNTWYKMTITANFGLREFASVQLQGGGIDFEMNLEGFPLEYPNYIPFDKASLTFYCFALRSTEFAPENKGGTKVYFDDISGSILTPTGLNTVFDDGFEDQAEIEILPIQLPVIPLANVEEELWYFENEDAKLRISDSMSRSGQRALECDASLAK